MKRNISRTNECKEEAQTSKIRKRIEWIKKTGDVRKKLNSKDIMIFLLNVNLIKFQVLFCARVTNKNPFSTK